MQTLIEVLPQDAELIAEELIRKHGHKEVIARFDNRDYLFPSCTHKNITYWWLLENGTAVGFNESPSIGFSFPYVGKKAIAKFYETHSNEKPQLLKDMEK